MPEIVGKKGQQAWFDYFQSMLHAIHFTVYLFNLVNCFVWKHFFFKGLQIITKVVGSQSRWKFWKFEGGGEQVVMWWEDMPPSLNRVNWSAKIWGGTVCWIEVKVAVLCAQQCMPWSLLIIKVLNDFWNLHTRSWLGFSQKHIWNVVEEIVFRN